MEGEWTFGSLRAHFDALRAADAKRVDDLRASDVLRMEQRFQAVYAAAEAATAAAQRAVDLYSAATAQHFVEVNEFRAALKDQEGTFITRSEVDKRFDSITAALDQARSTLTSQAGTFATRDALDAAGREVETSRGTITATMNANSSRLANLEGRLVGYTSAAGIIAFILSTAVAAILHFWK